MAKNIVQTSLTRYDNNGLELIVDQSNGAVFASQRALARMCGVTPKAIRDWRNKGVYQINVISAQISTKGGVQGGELFDEDAIFEVFKEYNSDLLVQCAKAGLRMYLHGLAGYRYEIKQEIPKRPEPIDLECGPDDLIALYEYRLAIEEGRTPDERSVEHIDLNYLDADLHNISLTFAKLMLADQNRFLHMETSFVVNSLNPAGTKKYYAGLKQAIKRRKAEIAALEKGQVTRLLPTWDATALTLPAGK
jgi:hypothetical protein